MHRLTLYLSICAAVIGLVLFFTHPALAATNVFYSVGQSTATNHEAGSSTVTIASGTAVFSIAQTGNIGVGDKVTYGASSVAFISGKLTTDDTQWSLVTATGSVPANISGASVTSITRAFASLSAAISGFTGASYLTTSSLVSANAIVNIPCYYDTGPDTTAVTIPSSVITSASTYLNIYTPNNTSTQANFSQRHTGRWTSNAYQLNITNGGGISINNNGYVRIAGLQIELTVNTTSSANYYGISASAISSSTSYIVIDSNLFQGNTLTTGSSSVNLGGFVSGNGGAALTNVNVLINNVAYNMMTASSSGFYDQYGTGYFYNNTVYNAVYGYRMSGGHVNTSVEYANNIAQGTLSAGYSSVATNASSSDNISNFNDAPGSSAEDLATVLFASTSTGDFHLSVLDTKARGWGINLTNDTNYPFAYDIDGQARPSTGAWDAGADEWVGASAIPPTITSFTMPATSTSLTVPVTSFTATSTVYPIAGYLISQSSSTPTSTNPNWSIAIPTTFTFSGYGTSTAFAWVTDVYGNISSSTMGSVVITSSLVPPTLGTSTVSSIATSSVILNGIITSIGNATATAEGFNYGSSTVYGFIASTTGSFATGTFSQNISGLLPNTTYHFQAFATNSAGTGTSTDATFFIDTIPPSITSFTIPATSTSLTVPVTSFTATDNVGVAEYLITQSSSTPSSTNPSWSAIAPTTFTFGGAGTETAYAWAMDAAGNISSSTSATVNITISLVNVFYSVGQSTATNLETGSSTVTITSGNAVFSIAQTGNIGVGDKVTYGASSSVAFISGKVTTDDTQWSLVTATGSIPANITGASVSSIKRAFSSLSSAISGFSGASFLTTSSLVSANAIINIPCYYDTGPDTTVVTIPNSVITSTSTYLNIYTPNNTSTQANFSQRHTGRWTSNAYQLNITNGGGISIATGFVRVTGLQIELTVSTTTGNFYGINLNNIPTTVNSVLLVDSNIFQGNTLTTGSSSVNIDALVNLQGATPITHAAAVLNNIAYNMTTGSSTAFNYKYGTGYFYNNTVYNTMYGYESAPGFGNTSVEFVNNIAQSIAYGAYYNISQNVSSSNNISNLSDAVGNNPQDLATVFFMNTSTGDFHLTPFDPAARNQGVNLTNDANYPFTWDIDAQTRPTSTVWDIGAAQYTGQLYPYTPPTITSFTLPSTASSAIVAISSFNATDTLNLIAGYLITESSSTPSLTNANWTTAPTPTFTFGGIGTRAAYAWVTDAYGNISSSTTAIVTITPYFTPVSPSSSLPQTFFSMDWNRYLTGNSGTVSSPTVWPSVPFGGIRLWDNYVAWQTLETASGTYNWTGLTNWLAAAAASGTDVLYTFGRTPQWASSNPSQSCGYGSGCAAPPSDIASGDNIWKSFVTALVEQSLNSTTGHIKYYELWNEPNELSTWTGTDAQMVTMASDAYTIIHNLDPNAIVLGPSAEGVNAASWLSGYYAAGGAPYQDAVSFHAYVGSNPIALLSVVGGIRSLMANYGIGNEQLISTEGNWGATGLTDPQKVAYLGQLNTFFWSIRSSQNIGRFYWYTWDSNDQFGGLTNASSGAPTGETINAAGIAYGLLDNWLVGSVSPSSPCYQTADLTWNCTLTLADGDPAMIMWTQETTPVIKSVSSAFTTYQTLATSTPNTIVANTVSIGNEPILLVQNDEVAPVITSFTMPSTAVSTTVAVASFSVTDSNSSDTQYLITESSSTPSSTNPNWTATALTTFTFAGGGTRIAYAWAITPDGTISNSANQTVAITLPSTPPTLSTSTASSITTSTVIMNGTVASIGSASATVEGFNYGTSTAYGLVVSSTGSFGAGMFSQTLSGLLPGTTYHFQAFATSNAGTGTSTDQTFTTTPALENVYYSVGQSTSTNLMMGSPTLTITAGLGTFSIPQTGDIGVGDQIAYGDGSVAYISGKMNSNDEQWTLVTSTGGIPANVSGASITSINRAFASLSAAVNGMSSVNYLATSSLAAANVIVNLPCYYDTGPDMLEVSIPSSLITSTSTYLNIYTPNNTATQANISQRHQGKWTLTAYQLVVSGGNAAIDIRTNYVRMTGLQIELISSGNYQRDIRMDNISGSGGYIVLDSNIVQSQVSGNPPGPEGIGNNGAPADPTVVITNNVVYGMGMSTSSAVGIETYGGTNYVYNNTVYDAYLSYVRGGTSTSTYINNIAQDDNIGYGTQSGSPILSASSTDNISDHADAPGSNPRDSTTVSFVSTSTQDFHLSAADAAARGNGANLTSDPNYAFSDDIDGQTRPSSGAWDIGAAEYLAADTTPPVITSFTMPSISASLTVPVNSFIASDSVGVTGYLITASASTPSSADPDWSAGSPVSFTFGNAGMQTAYAWAMDAAGNISSSTDQTVTIASVPSGGGAAVSVTSGGGGYYTPISTTSTTVSTSTSLPTTQPGIEALLTSLESELRGLLSQAAAQGISVPDVASFSSFTFTRNLTIGSKGADVAALQHYLNTHNFSVVSTPGYAGSFGYETKYFGVNTQAALARFQKSVDIAPPFGYFGPITRTYVNAHE
jgi:hypothetical protein